PQGAGQAAPETPATDRTDEPQSTAAQASQPMDAGKGGAAALVTRTSPSSTVTGASARVPEAEADERTAAHHAAAGTDPRAAADAGAGTSTTPAPADAGAGTSTTPARAGADAAWRPTADGDAGAGMRARLIALEEGSVLLDLGGVTHRFRHAAHGASHWLGRDGDAWRVVGHDPVSYTHLRAHETLAKLVCRLLLEKKKTVQSS
ncbi:hypothetical protein JBE27_52005, partial [Streptomyces albiflaviniger]|nr:hypothetical protein [Streptomyces albiflaviniger]